MLPSIFNQSDAAPFDKSLDLICITDTLPE